MITESRSLLREGHQINLLAPFRWTLNKYQRDSAL